MMRDVNKIQKWESETQGVTDFAGQRELKPKPEIG